MDRNPSFFQAIYQLLYNLHSNKLGGTAQGPGICMAREMSQLCCPILILCEFHAPAAKELVPLHGAGRHILNQCLIINPISCMNHIIIILPDGVPVRIIRQDEINCRNIWRAAIRSSVNTDILYTQFIKPCCCCQGRKPHAYNDNFMLFCHISLHLVHYRYFHNDFGKRVGFIRMGNRLMPVMGKYNIEHPLIHTYMVPGIPLKYFRILVLVIRNHCL